MTGVRRYAASRIRAAPPIEVVRLLLEEAVRRLNRVADDARRLEDVHHVRAILVELDSALDRGAEPVLVERLAALYAWCQAELLAIGRERSAARVPGVRKVLVTLLEAWHQAEARNRKVPV